MNLRVTKKVIIDAYRGGDDIGNSANGIVEKDYNLKISKYIYDRLRSLGIPVSLTRDSDETIDINNRVNRIKSFYGNGNDVIVISNALSSESTGPEIVYALRNSNGLSSKIANELEKTGAKETKFYQRRLPSDTSKDYNQLIRDTKNNESIIIYYGNINDDSDFLKSNQETLGEAVVIALADYLNVDYNEVTGSNYYIVLKGDTLYSIANKYNTTVTELKELNNLTNNNLKIGQVLKIPIQESNDNIEENIYVVKRGDTLYAIASQYNLTVDELKRINNLTSNTLSIGQILKVNKSNQSDDSNYITYKVVSGDTLYNIAKKYNTTVNDIKNLNNLSSNSLSIGQILKIKSSEKETSTNNYLNYKVVSGDSLYSIAKKYNTTVNAIKSLNNLTSNLLQIGQILKIPSSS